MQPLLVGEMEEHGHLSLHLSVSIRMVLTMHHQRRDIAPILWIWIVIHFTCHMRELYTCTRVSTVYIVGIR